MRAMIDLSLTLNLLVLIPACGGQPREGSRKDASND